jgi:hypothetical protein
MEYLVPSLRIATFTGMDDTVLYIILFIPVILLQHVFMFPKDPLFMRKVTGFLFQKLY